MTILIVIYGGFDSGYPRMVYVYLYLHSLAVRIGGFVNCPLSFVRKIAVQIWRGYAMLELSVK